MGKYCDSEEVQSIITMKWKLYNINGIVLFINLEKQI